MNPDTYVKLSSTCNPPSIMNNTSQGINRMSSLEMSNPMGGLYNGLSTEGKAAMWGAVGLIGVADTLFNSNNNSTW